MNIGPLTLLATLLIMMFVGFWFGVNTGIAHSMTYGAVEACQNMRWPLILCE